MAERRDFIRAASVSLGAAGDRPGSAPRVLDAEAAQAEVVARQRGEVAEAALAAARRLGADLRRHPHQPLRSSRYRRASSRCRTCRAPRTSASASACSSTARGDLPRARSVTPDEARRVTTQAVEIARANAPLQRKPIELAPVAKVVDDLEERIRAGSVRRPARREDPVLLTLNEAAMKIKGVSFVNSSMSWVNEQKFLATSRRLADRAVHHSRIAGLHGHGGRHRTAATSRRALPLRGPQGIGYEYMTSYPWMAEASRPAKRR